MEKTKRCSWLGCQETARPNQRYCRKHHAESMRKYRRIQREKELLKREEEKAVYERESTSETTADAA